MSTKRSGAAHLAYVLTLAGFGSVAAGAALSACSGSDDTKPAETPGGSGGATGSSGGAQAQGGGGAANPGGGGTTGSSGGAVNGGGGAQASGGTTGSSGGAVSGNGGSGQGGGGGKTFFAGSDANRNQVPAGQVCDRIATIQCAGEAFCCDAPGREFQACKATMKQGCNDSLFLDAVTLDPIAGYDTGGAEAIFKKFEDLASKCDTTVTAWGASFEGLRALARGTKASGADCKPADLSNKADAAAHLASCKDPEATACLPTLTTWQCVARSSAGGACFTDTNCNDGLYCDNPDLLPSPPPPLKGDTCKTRKADGQSCKTQNECTSLLCKGGKCAAATQQNAYCLKQ